MTTIIRITLTIVALAIALPLCAEFVECGHSHGTRVAAVESRTTVKAAPAAASGAAVGTYVRRTSRSTVAVSALLTRQITSPLRI